MNGTGSQPRVLILGATGLLGGHLVRRLPALFVTLAAPGRDGAVEGDAGVRWLPASVEASDLRTAKAALDASRPDVIVNAIAAKPPAEPSVLQRVNATFPPQLATLAEARGARVVQIGTDAVFSGTRGHYAEDSAPDPTDAYGSSKLAGELGAPHVTLRTSFFGRTPRRTGLIEWLTTQRGGVVDGLVDYAFSGVAAALLADLVAAAIEASLTGLYHVGGERVTKCDLLRHVVERLRLDIVVRPVTSAPIDRSLNAQKFFAAIGRTPPTLADSLDALAPCGVR
jgi:dTDP-4-dehydrorhamnose reductase